MKAYAVVQETIHDEETFAAYRKEVLPTIAAHGGVFLARGGAFTLLEGEAPFARLVIIEFPSRAAAEAWYKSPEYQKILPLRLRSSSGNFILIDGVP
jgi:uncharacterized protein (DUF1330 family)